MGLSYKMFELTSFTTNISNAPEKLPTPQNLQTDEKKN